MRSLTIGSRQDIPWFGPRVGKSEEKAVLKVLASNYINDGDVTRELEASVAELIGVQHCVAVTSGTTAIALALMGLGIGPGDEVIVPDLTFIATANAVRLAGAQVKLVDIEPQRFGLDSEKTAAAIGPATRAVVTVDVNGRGAAYEELEPLCRERGLALICDAAEAFGSRYRGRALGSFGDAGCFSFAANKTVTSGQGGMIATDDTDLYHRLLELKDQGRREQGTGGNDLHPVMGYNFKYTNLQAAVALAQLKRLPGRIALSQKRDRWYRDLLADCPGVILPPLDRESGEVRQWTDILVEERERAEEAFRDRGIGHRSFWYPIHSQAPYAADDESYPVALAVSAKGLWLPSSFDLTYEQARTVAGVLRQALTSGG